MLDIRFSRHAAISHSGYASVDHVGVEPSLPNTRPGQNTKRVHAVLRPQTFCLGMTRFFGLAPSECCLQIGPQRPAHWHKAYFGLRALCVQVWLALVKNLLSLARREPMRAVTGSLRRQEVGGQWPRLSGSHGLYRGLGSLPAMAGQNGKN